MKTKILRKSKIGWVLTPTSIIAFDKIQATIYHAYGMPTRQPISAMRKTLLKSKPEEYNSWVDVIGLARKQGVIGYGTRLKDEWFIES